MRALILTLFFVILTGPLVAAQITPPRLKDNCQRAENTADILACENKKYENAQLQLNRVYEDTLAAEEGTDTVTLLRETQQRWIEYRDQECHRQLKHVHTPSLEQAKRIDCLSDLTTQRIQALRATSSQRGAEDEMVEAYDALPRWINRLSKTHPDTYWQFGRHQYQDLNCDGLSENIVTGLQIENGAHQAVIAVISTPKTGRPESFVTMAINDDKDGKPVQCAPILDIHPGAARNADTNDAAPALTCATQLHIKGPGCAAQHIHWTGSAYAHTTAPTEESSPAQNLTTP